MDWTKAVCILLAIGIFGIGFMFGRLSTPQIRQPSLGASITVRLYDIAGAQTAYYSLADPITAIGEQYVRNAIGFNNITGWPGSSTPLPSRMENCTEYISLGNSSAARSKTKLDTEITTANLTRTLGTVSSWYNSTSGHYAYNVTYTFMASSQIGFNCAGLHWLATSNSDNNMFACGYVLADGGTQVLTAGSKIQIIWTVTWAFQ
jgi:hypothetical protein